MGALLFRAGGVKLALGQIEAEPSFEAVQDYRATQGKELSAMEALA
jgi:hypothetical protein